MESTTTRLLLVVVAATVLVTLVAGTAAACDDPLCDTDCDCNHSTGLLDGALHDAVHEFHGVVLGTLAVGLGVTLTAGRRAVR
jgi:heme A synthase